MNPRDEAAGYSPSETKNEGDRDEIRACEDCFFQAVANLKQERLTQSLFCDNGKIVGNDFGLV
jgi:hypothetical protein